MKTFDEFDISPKLMRAIAKLGFSSPTLVQETAIPLALQGKDILARAKTGSGKTAAYCIPILQKVLSKVSHGKEIKLAVLCWPNPIIPSFCILHISSKSLAFNLWSWFLQENWHFK
jgi:superfamily II DNA/RNA helicase